MDTRRYDFVEEIRDEAYRRLLSACSRYCDRAVLVVRAREQEECREAVDALRPFVRLEFQSGQWPGTVSWDEAASVYWLDLSEGCVTALGEQVDGLLDWQTQRGQPEDLSLLSEDGREFLVSVAHEAEAWMWLTPAEHADLTRRVPGLARLLTAPAG